MSDLIRIDIACADEAEAKNIAETLVSERLAACCQITPMTSVYRWKDQVETAEEIRLSVKTVATNFDAIAAHVATLHSYDVPQITAFPIVRATDDYSAWVQDNSG